MLQRKYMYKYQPYTMSRRNGPPGPAPFNVKYEPLANHDGYIDLQFKRPPPRVPYKAIAMATVLFLLGSLLIVIGACLLTGVIDSKDISKCCGRIPTKLGRQIGIRTERGRCSLWDSSFSCPGHTTSGWPGSLGVAGLAIPMRTFLILMIEILGNNRKIM
uniref:transmembrane protein 230 isoform X1 n=2 Tax=Myxine glutinosa TaxID=7769 RepID=UPI00358E012A